MNSRRNRGYGSGARRAFGGVGVGYLDDLESVDSTLMQSYYDASGESVVSSGGVTFASNVPAATPQSVDWWKEYLEPLSKAGTAVLTYKTAQSVSEINMDRARKGLPLLTAQQMSALSPQVNVGLSADMQKMMLYGGIALLGFMAINSMGRRR